MFPNDRVEKYYKRCSELLDFGGLSWWIIDLEDDPGLFYCNANMCKTFALDENLDAHSVARTCPIAGDYNQNIAIRSSALAKQIFQEYYDLRHGLLEEYSNHFPYYDERADEVLYFSSRAKALERDEEGNAVLLLGIIEPEYLSAELYHKAKTDGLTGLLNRREFDSQLEFLIQLAQRNKLSLSMIMCDVDYFKNYNDTLGHYAGDDCLKQISAAIQRVCSRSSDHVFRYGGEEFAVLVTGEVGQTPSLAEEIRKEVQELNLFHPKSHLECVTLSVGYASLSDGQALSAQEIIERSDKALYQAKKMGRNQCCGFDVNS